MYITNCILPLCASDYVVLGDPDARTHVGIHLSPALLTVSANSHGLLSHVTQSDIAGVTCGGHFVLSMEGCSVEGTMAMYGGDDSIDRIQHTSLQVKVCGVWYVCVCVHAHAHVVCVRACVFVRSICVCVCVGGCGYGLCRGGEKLLSGLLKYTVNY